MAKKKLYTIKDIASITGTTYREVYETIKLMHQKPTESELILLYDNSTKDNIVNAVYANIFIELPSKMNKDWNPKEETLTQFLNRWKL